MQTHHLLFPSESSYPTQTSKIIPPRHRKVLWLAKGANRMFSNVTRRRGWSWRTCKACPTVRLKPPAVSYTDVAVQRHDLLEPHPSPTPTTQKNRRSVLKIHTKPWCQGIVEADNMQVMNILTNHVMCSFQMPTTLWIPINFVLKNPDSITTAKRPHKRLNHTEWTFVTEKQNEVTKWCLYLSS